MSNPSTNPDVLLDETNAALKQSGTSLPLSEARAFLTEWITQLDADMDPAVEALTDGLRELLPLLSGTQPIPDSIKPMLKGLGLQVKAMADAMPDDEVGGGGTPGGGTGGTAQRRLKQRMSDLAFTLTYMAL